MTLYTRSIYIPIISAYVLHTHLGWLVTGRLLVRSPAPPSRVTRVSVSKAPHPDCSPTSRLSPRVVDSTVGVWTREWTAVSLFCIKASAQCPECKRKCTYTSASCIHESIHTLYIYIPYMSAHVVYMRWHTQHIWPWIDTQSIISMCSSNICPCGIAHPTAVNTWAKHSRSAVISV